MVAGDDGLCIVLDMIVVCGVALDTIGGGSMLLVRYSDCLAKALNLSLAIMSGKSARANSGNGKLI